MQNRGDVCDSTCNRCKFYSTSNNPMVSRMCTLYLRTGRSRIDCKSPDRIFKEV